MEAPKCPKCNERHWSTQPCKAVVSKPIAVESVKVRITSKAKFDRNAYQREYMRLKRESDKLKKDTGLLK